MSDEIGVYVCVCGVYAETKTKIISEHVFVPYKTHLIVFSWVGYRSGCYFRIIIADMMMKWF